MSRPSRGFTGQAVPSIPVDVCPSGGSTSADELFPDNYNLVATWFPDVEVGVLTFRATVNGGSSFEVGDVLDTMSGASTSTVISDYASPGDVVSFWADCVLVVGCGDFSTTPVVVIVT